MLFRSMSPAPDGCPASGSSRRTLGVKTPDDIAVDADGDVHPNTGGMSVSPCTMWNLPAHRRPKGMGRGSTGKSGDFVYGLPIQSQPRAGLFVRIDVTNLFEHAFVEPNAKMPLVAYEAALQSTRADWVKVWP